jgi:uncharacterized Zn-binding protein involved in type VI secretion
MITISGTVVFHVDGRDWTVIPRWRSGDTVICSSRSGDQVICQAFRREPPRTGDRYTTWYMVGESTTGLQACITGHRKAVGGRTLLSAGGSRTCSTPTARAGEAP